MTGRQSRPRGLVDELQRSHRFTVAVLVSVLLLSLATSGYLIGVSQPRLAGLVQLTKKARDAHDGMLDQETGLRAWLATGDPDFLQPYRTGRTATEVAVADLTIEIRHSPSLTSLVTKTLVARQAWEGWADRAVTTRFSNAQRASGALTTFLLQGKALFDRYRAADAISTGRIIDMRTKALAHQTIAVIGVLISYALLLGVSGLVTVRRRRRLNSTILRPIADLHDAVAALRAGELDVRPPPTTVPELEEIGAALGGLAGDLSRARADAKLRERRLAKLAYRFETVVRVGREIAGSLSVRYVSATVTTAASELLNTTAVLWLYQAEQFTAVSRSQDAHGMTPPADLVPPDLVLRAATEAHTVTDATESAYPLVLAGSVTAVLQVSTTVIDLDTEQVLSSLLSTAAVALESAHLHSTAREQADLDGLTHLPNRRRFGADIDEEWERCRRYGRPLSLVMMDLDHFKTLNDVHGHLLGDQVLREVAQAVGAALRTSDTAYRYGGEEIVVMLRETGLEDSRVAAERLREAVASVTLTDHPDIAVSTSAGVATLRPAMAHYTELVAAADAALYEAKRQGRNRVVATVDAGETLFSGGHAPDVVADPTPPSRQRSTLEPSEGSPSGPGAR